MPARASTITDTLVRQARRVRLPFRWKTQRYALRPTKYGIIFLLMLTALLIGSINHNNNFGYLLTFLLGGIVLVSLPYSYGNLQDLSLTPLPARPVFAGDDATMPFLLHSTRPLKPGITGQLDHSSSVPVDLVDSTSTKLSIAVPTVERGMLRRDTVTLATDFPLGLIEMSTTLPVSLSCLVYPAPLAGGLITDTVNNAEGDGTATGLGGETEFTELAPYRFGDDVRRIHWKSLAAEKGLHTIRYEEAYAGGILFSLSSLPGDAVEFKLGRLCHMILSAESRGMKYGLQLGDSVIGQSAGAAHRSACLKALALYR